MHRVSIPENVELQNKLVSLCGPESLYFETTYMYFVQEYRKALRRLPDLKRSETCKFTAGVPWNEEAEEGGLRRAYDASSGECELDLRKIEGITVWSMEALKLMQPDLVNWLSSNLEAEWLDRWLNADYVQHIVETNMSR